MMGKREKALWWTVLAASIPVIYALTRLQPTFDDWTYLTYPNQDPHWQQYFLPYGNYWRPFDALFGYLLGLDLRLFPALNHIVIGIGHLLGACMVYLVGCQLRFSALARTVSTFFFLLSPAMLGAVLGIDSINQIYASTFGLMALWCYLGGRLYPWLLACLLATLSKENGITWLIIAPCLGYTFQLTEGRQLKRHLIIAAACMLCYAIVRTSLPHYNILQENEYLASTWMSKLTNGLKWILLTFCSADFISLFHRPSLNLPFLLFTGICGVPFILLLILKKGKFITTRKGLVLVAAMLVAASPHLLTLFSTMHAYASLGLAALLMAYLLTQVCRDDKLYLITFALYLLSAIMVDSRHYIKSYESGMTGYRMAEDVIRQARRPAQSAWTIHVDRGEAKYSSFCVTPFDAFGWGNAVYFHTRHQWPKKLGDETLGASTTPTALDRMVKRRLAEGYDQVWIVEGDRVKVVER